MNKHVTKCKDCIKEISECPIRESQIQRGLTPAGCNLITNNTKSEREELTEEQLLKNNPFHFSW